MGELARQPGCPELAATPLELLTPRPGDGYTVFQKWALPVAGAVTGILIGNVRNATLNRPLWAGIQYHLISAGLLACGGIYFRNIKNAAAAETDEVYKHYITLHPEDFPPFERKRYRDVYQPFFPIR